MPTILQHSELKALQGGLQRLFDPLGWMRIPIPMHGNDRAEDFLAEPFQDNQFQGVRPYSRELVDILKSRGHVGSYQILELLGITPGEAEAIKSVSKQLEELEKFNLVKADGKGWQWIR